MHWEVALSTFGLIFLAELGDKLQLATITMSAKAKAPWARFRGAALLEVVPEDVLKRIARSPSS
jgi:putative Ca2+/H+ antiporter (TMEM165/GDT1 family)